MRTNRSRPRPTHANQPAPSPAHFAKLVRRSAVLLASGILFAQSSPDPTVRIDVNLVQVDAVVTDRANRAVPNLTAADFEILQDGTPQTIKSFSWIDTGTGRSGGKSETQPLAQTVLGGQPPLPRIDLKAADVRRTFAVVVDDLGLAWESYPAVKQALQKFVGNQKQPGDLMAVLPTGGGSGIFRQFTSYFPT
jgi:VWFA-related protein